MQRFGPSQGLVGTRDTGVGPMALGWVTSHLFWMALGYHKVPNQTKPGSQYKKISQAGSEGGLGVPSWGSQPHVPTPGLSVQILSLTIPWLLETPGRLSAAGIVGLKAAQMNLDG